MHAYVHGWPTDEWGVAAAGCTGVQCSHLAMARLTVKAFGRCMVKQDVSHTDRMIRSMVGQQLLPGMARFECVDGSFECVGDTCNGVGM
jgi:hypothetical protein